MDLLDLLAEVCVANQLVKEAVDLPAVRSEFEDLAAKERLARAHAGRLEELAGRRAKDEDTSPLGYLETAGKRLVPMPHSGLEAAVRVPAMVAGGIYGHRMGQKSELMPSEDILKAVTARTGKEEGVSTLERALQDIVNAPHTTFQASAPVKSYVDPANLGKSTEAVKTPSEASIMAKSTAGRLRKLDPSVMSEALGEKVPFRNVGPEAERVRKYLDYRVQGGTSRVRQEFKNILRQTAEKSTLAEGALQAMKPRRLLGAGAGALGAGALAGLPFMARALYHKRHGGEAAVSARSKAEKAIGEATGASQKREQLLGQLLAGEAK